jgi:hypothetical protein
VFRDSVGISVRCTVLPGIDVFGHPEGQSGLHAIVCWSLLWSSGGQNLGWGGVGGVCCMLQGSRCGVRGAGIGAARRQGAGGV